MHSLNEELTLGFGQVFSSCKKFPRDFGKSLRFLQVGEVAAVLFASRRYHPYSNGELFLDAERPYSCAYLEAITRGRTIGEGWCSCRRKGAVRIRMSMARTTSTDWSVDVGAFALQWSIELARSQGAPTYELRSDTRCWHDIGLRRAVRKATEALERC